jgi:hypothetical protein
MVTEFTQVNHLKKLRVSYIGEATAERPVSPRCYTLTHSDLTGDLFLSIGTGFDKQAVSGWYTRLMRDEVLAEYRFEGQKPELHVFCHVSGGLVFGPAAWRYRIFKYHLPGVLEAFRYGDSAFIQANPHFDQAHIRVYFKSHRPRFNRVEDWGLLTDYNILKKNS